MKCSRVMIYRKTLKDGLVKIYKYECENEAEPGHKLCRLHLDRLKKQYLSSKYYKIIHHKCIRCGDELADENLNQVCPLCIEKMRIRFKRRYQKLKKNNCCPLCGKPKTILDTNIVCNTCKNKTAFRMYESRGAL